MLKAKAFLICLLLATHAVASDKVPPKVWESSKSVCKVMVPNADGSVSYGSGTYIGANLVVTAAHVTGRNLKGWVNFSTTNESVRFNTWCEETHIDFALVVLEKEPSVKPVKVAEVGLRQGDHSYIVGHPKAVQQLQITRSLAGGLDAERKWRATHNEAGVLSGYSGGATFNVNGEFIGPVWGSRYFPQQGMYDKYARSVCLSQTRRYLFPWNARLAATGLYAGST